MSPGRMKHVCNLRWRSIILKLEKSLISVETYIASLGIMKSQLRAPLQPLNTIQMPWYFGGVSGEPMHHSRSIMMPRDANLYTNAMIFWRCFRGAHASFSVSNDAKRRNLSDSCTHDHYGSSILTHFCPPLRLRNICCPRDGSRIKSPRQNPPDQNPPEKK